MWQALDYSVDILANVLYCMCQICHFNSLRKTIEHRNGKKGTLKFINKKGTRCKYKINVCCACIMINELEQNLNDIVQKIFLNACFFDTSILQKSMVS